MYVTYVIWYLPSRQPQRPSVLYRIYSRTELSSRSSVFPVKYFYDAALRRTKTNETASRYFTLTILIDAPFHDLPDVMESSLLFPFVHRKVTAFICCSKEGAMYFAQCSNFIDVFRGFYWPYNADLFISKYISRYEHIDVSLA